MPQQQQQQQRRRDGEEEEENEREILEPAVTQAPLFAQPDVDTEPLQQCLVCLEPATGERAFCVGAAVLLCVPRLRTA